MQITRRTMLAATIAGGIASRLPAAEPAHNSWPSWRGTNRNGYCPEGDWPESLDSLEKLWSVELSDSYSGPIVFDGLVATTATVDQRDEHLWVLNAATGEKVWQQQWPGAMQVPFFAKSNGDWIRSTPATNGEKVVVAGMCDVLACFDWKTGEEAWRIDFVKDHGAELPPFGLVCSPLIDGEHVYIQAGGAVRKISVLDGGLIWDAMPDEAGMSGGAFSSPMIATIHGVRQLVTQTRTKLGGIELESGKVLWSRDIASFRGMNILTPTVWNDSVFVSSYGGKSQLLNITKQGDTWSANDAWTGKAEAYMSSPIRIENDIYLHLKNKRFACIDWQTGEERWRTTPMGAYWSMITNGSRILSLDDLGTLRLIQPNREKFDLRSSVSVSDQASWAHVAMAGDQIFIRRQRGLDAYRWQA